MFAWLIRRSHHLRWQLVAGFTLSVALLLGLLIVAERVIVQQSLTNDIAHGLSTDVNLAIRGLPVLTLAEPAQAVESSSTITIGGSSSSPKAVSISSAASLVNSLSAPDQPVAYLDGSGSIVASAVALKRNSVSVGSDADAVLAALVRSATRHIASSASWSGTVVTPGGDFLEVVQPVGSTLTITQSGLGSASGPIGKLSAVGGVAVTKGAGAVLTAVPGAVVPVVTLGPTTVVSGSASGVLQVTSQPLTALTVQQGTILIARSLADTEQTVRTVTLISLVGAAAVLLLTVVLALIVVRAALRPLATITGGVERLAEGDFAYRLAAPAGSDEVGRLASAFDRMASAIGVAFATQRRFVADASHELRTPLTALRGYTDVLLLGVRDDPETADRVLHAMQEDLTRMTRLVNDLLTLARLDGEASLRVELIDFRDLLAGIQDEAAVLAGELHTVCFEPCGEPLMVLADRDRLRQVLSNILGNACTYATEGTPIVVRACRRGSSLAVTVRDQGPGIAPEALARLGERFYRGDNARSRRTGGTGLGIAIARGIMRTHGGSLTLDSVVGQGTTVTITMPLAQVPAR